MPSGTEYERLATKARFIGALVETMTADLVVLAREAGRKDRTCFLRNEPNAKFDARPYDGGALGLEGPPPPDLPFLPRRAVEGGKAAPAQAPPQLRAARLKRAKHP
jgi:hypothetical protein